MREGGASDEVIDDWRDKQDALAEIHADTEAPFTLWPENERPLMVLQLCQFDRISGMGGSAVAGVQTVEIAAVMDTLGIDRADRAELLMEVRGGIAVAVTEMNRER